MTALPPAIHAAVTDALGPIASTRPMSGGDVNHAALVTAGGAPCVVKWRDQTPPGFFAIEADGLRRLSATNTLRVPQVLAVGDAPAFLILEYLPPQTPRDEHAFTQRFAEGLAALHHVASPTGKYGLEHDNFLGSQPQPNGWLDTWPDFYRTRRLLPQWGKARGRGLIPAHRERLLSQVAEQLDTLLDYDARPVLIHGDLWSGNFLSTTNDQPVLIDPAVHYADREVELAFVELFGRFPRGFVRAYDSAYPLNGGYARRRALHQLYPLLVHLNHFGETYGPSVDRACVDALG